MTTHAAPGTTVLVHPLLVRMKELEMLGEILQSTKATIVLGAGDMAGQITVVSAERIARTSSMSSANCSLVIVKVGEPSCRS